MRDWLDDPAQQARFLDYIRLDAEVLPSDAPGGEWTPSILEAVVKSPYAMGLSLVLHEYLERYGELDSLGDVKSRGMVRLESWLAATEGKLPVSIWPKMRPLTYRELKRTDPEHPAAGELCYIPSKGLWLPFQDATHYAVESLKRKWMHRGMSKPEPEPTPIDSDRPETGLTDSNVELSMSLDGTVQVVTGYLPAIEALEDIELRIAEATRRRIPRFDQDGTLDRSLILKNPRPKP